MGRDLSSAPGPERESKHVYYSEIMPENGSRSSSAAKSVAFCIHRQKNSDDQSSNDCYPYTTHLDVFATSSPFSPLSHHLAFFHEKKGDSISPLFFGYVPTLAVENKTQ